MSLFDPASLIVSQYGGRRIPIGLRREVRIGGDHVDFAGFRSSPTAGPVAIKVYLRALGSFDMV